MNNSITTCMLQGGLGNIMFQIAATIGYAKKHNKIYRFYKKLYGEIKHGHISEYLSNVLKRVKLMDMYEYEAQFNTYQELYFNYHEIPKTNNSILLIGYFQSDKYFNHCEQYIKDFFSFSIENNQYADIFRNQTTCSIHVRRGDYLKLSEYHIVQDLAYYTEAIDLFDTDTTFLISSDDICWCRENFNSNNFGNDRKFIFLENNKSYIDLFYMMNCNHNIISNSTFSWWAAWLNSNKNKKIVCPSSDRWFGPAYSDKNAKDIACKDWIII